MPNNKKTEKNKCKRFVPRPVRNPRTSERHKTGVYPIEIELSNEFKQIVLASNNPAIQLAKSRNTSYTVVMGSDIVEVKGTEYHVVGKIEKSDVHISKGTVYKLSQ